MKKVKDFIGEKEIPDDAKYGINAARAYENFGDFGDRTDPLLIKAYLQVKKACALANLENNYLNKIKAEKIISAIDMIINSNDFSAVIINPVSGGAGTSLNMNINEFIASTAGNDINPVDDVNMHQSTNDTYPTAFKIAILYYLKDLENALKDFQSTLQTKENEFSNIIKLGRTELMDALPITVGMQFSAYSEAIARDRWRIFKAAERIKTVNLGGTAIGTGFGAPQKYIFTVIRKLQEITGLNISRAENMIDSTQNLDSVVEVMAIIKSLAVNLNKISEDLRIMSSGPEGGFGEFILPAVQEGSSIMPGKTNPVIPEFVNQIALLVIGNDAVISAAAAKGNLELNQFLPLISTLSLKNMRMLVQAVKSLDKLCIKDIKVNENRIKNNLSDSVAVLTYLAQYIGHNKASELYLKYKAGQKDIKKLLVEEGALTSQQYDELMSPDKIRIIGYK